MLVRQVLGHAPSTRDVDGPEVGILHGRTRYLQQDQSTDRQTKNISVAIHFQQAGPRWLIQMSLSEQWRKTTEKRFPMSNRIAVTTHDKIEIITFSLNTHSVQYKTRSAILHVVLR